MPGINFWAINDKIQDVTEKIINTSFKDYSFSYLKQSDEELMMAARKKLIKKDNVMNYVKKSDIEARISGNVLERENKEYLNDASKLLKSIDAKDIGRANEIAQDISKKYDDNRFYEYLQDAEGEKAKHKNFIETTRNPDNIFMSKVKTPKALDNFIDETDKDKLKGLAYRANGLGQYFNSGDIKTNQKRLGTVAGGYMGAAAGVRLLKGGGLTENEYGQRDIVGVPLI